MPAEGRSRIEIGRRVLGQGTPTVTVRRTNIDRAPPSRLRTPAPLIAVRGWAGTGAEGATRCYHQPAEEGANDRERVPRVARETSCARRTASASFVLCPIFVSPTEAPMAEEKAPYGTRAPLHWRGFGF